MRLDELARREGDDISIEWKSFLLRPAPEQRGREEFANYTNSWSRPSSLEPETDFSFPWSGGEPPESSVPSAIAGKVAATFGVEASARFHHLLLEAYFAHNRTISDMATLLEVAEAAGIDGNEFSSTYADQERPLLRQVYDEHNLAVNSGVTGVPAVVVGERYLIPGAVDVEQYEEVLAHVRSERSQ